MSAETLLLGLTKSIVAIAEQVIAAIKAGDREKAAELAEEAARRQALILRRRLKSQDAKKPEAKAKGKKNGKV